MNASASLASLLDEAATGFAPEQRELFAAFAESYLRGIESHHAGGESILATLAAEAFAWARQREPGRICVRVRNPEDRPGNTVIDVLQDDRPFIVDTLSLALARHGLQERLVLRPLLQITRDAEGHMQAVGPSQNGGPLESYVYVEVLPRIEDPSRLEELERTVREVMGWVRDITEDHRRMVRSIRELMANLEYAGPFIEGGPKRAANIERFLGWLVDGRFVLIGMRRYRVREAGGELEVQIDPGTGLGMWRDDDSSRLREARRGAAIPGEILDDLEDPRIILISKSHMESRIHRHGRLDRIVVKEHDDQGRVIGFGILVGLFTRIVLRTPGSQVPLLSERLREVVDRIQVTQGSHQHKSIVAAFDSAPIELLIGADVEAIVDLLQELVEAAGSKAVRLLLRSHPRGRTLYAATLLPRENYREDLRAEVRQILERETNASYIDDRTSFVDDDTAIIHCFCTSSESEAISADRAKLEEAIRYACSPWEDQLFDALRERYGEERAPVLAARYETAFPEELRARTHPVDAVRDVEALEAFAETGEPEFSLYFDRGAPESEGATLRMYLPEAPLLSDIMHVADRFGIRVIDAQLASVEPADRPPVAVESLRILPLGAVQADLDAIFPRLSEALAMTISKQVSSDTLNGLVLGAGLDWRQVDLIRAYVEYFLQIQGALSRPFIRSVLLENPLAVRALGGYFEALHDPALAEDERAGRVERLRGVFESYRDRIPSLNEDRVLVGLFELIDATLRSNFFVPPSTPPRVVLKFDSERISELAGVVPYREIFVHCEGMMGIHLRGGPVARGGLRWSDRRDDLRVEILGLMSTQMLKNGIIVPVGAKGGFVLRRTGLTPGEARALADEQYRVFIESLLDVTDNLALDGEVLPPPDVRRLDGDDPYLVVAADKGTAHLSDSANEIAMRRDFWLGDAFASGGSEGYDHKKYAITARGAWECVKHHFADLEIDPERSDYSVVGIGDMSGDVFGNGMLLARRARLLAAFDHRHVFLDPDPDPETAWSERKRLFELPRSSWADYDPARISPGGGVHLRNAKRVEVSAPLRERLGLESEAVSGQELVRAILRMEVDLLWNGGIGTYVKGSHESNAEVGDRANDAVRIDASELRARVVGEGGNLGLTQAARVEASLCGVRLDTDAIHNSAGVDLSDHEVNYKIALAPLVRSGRLDAAARSELLVSVAEDACASALSHNRSQALAISLDELRSRRDPEVFLRAVEELCAFARLSPDELRLPDAATLSDRATRGEGFTRPELATLLCLAKQHAQAELMASGLTSADELEPVYRAYFPERFTSELPVPLGDHPLRREITSLRLVNRLIDAGGAALMVSLTSELGVGIERAAAAMLQAEDVLNVPSYRWRVLSEGRSRAGIYAALVELDDGVRIVAHYLVRSGAGALDPATVQRIRAGILALSSAARDFLSPGELQRFDARWEPLSKQGLPDDLAHDIAGIPLADRGLDILRVCEETSTSPIETARVYARVGDATGINWAYARLGQAGVTSLWDRILLLDVRWDLLDLQRRIAEEVLASKPDDPAAAVEAFLDSRADVISSVQALQRQSAAAASTSAIVVITARLRSLLPNEVE
jgi:glutamate dehydrogenase